jgi:ankyrin repeat protein
MRSLSRVDRRWLVLMVLMFTVRVVSTAEMRLIDSIKNGDARAVEMFLGTGIDVNAAEPDGTTALHWAVHQGETELVARLIRVGARVNATNRYGVSPLSLACVNGSAEIVELLLGAGANANAALAGGETPLMTAARTGTVGVIRALVSNGADVQAHESWRGQTALMWAAAENNAAAVKVLLEAGADLQAHSNAGFTPLLYAARAGGIDTVRVLLAAGADVNEALPDGVGPLMLAIINAKFELATLLLDEGADPNSAASGWTPLHQVAWTRRPNVGHNSPQPVHTDSVDSLDLVRDLLNRGADVEARVKKEPRTGLNSFKRIGATPFLVAAKSLDLPLMRLLLDYGADPWSTNNDGTDALMVAAGVGMFAPGEDAGTPEEAFEAVTFLVRMGFDVTAVDANGDTALHGAAFRGADDAVKFLVSQGSDPGAVNKKGWTPLRVADGIQINGTLKSQPRTAALLRELTKTESSKP